MKERPILFSGPMVRALIEGRKTQTRRVVKPQPTPISFAWEWIKKAVRLEWGELASPAALLPFCPYGKPGDRLWVRETFAEADSEGGPVIAYRAGGHMVHGASGSENAGTWKDEIFPGEVGEVYPPDQWTPSIFMPRWASRITLEIVSVRVERLQEISRDDAEAEGVTSELCRDLFLPQAKRFKAEPIYYIEAGKTGALDGDDYCLTCAKAEAAKQPKEQEWDWHRDSGESDGAYHYCANCQKALMPEGLTAYACEVEFSEGILSNGVPTSDWDGAMAYQAFEFAQYYQDDRRMMEHFHRPAIAASGSRSTAPGSWALNPWVWVVEFKRVNP